MFFTDNYSHPISDVTYINESILGPGVNKDDFYTWFKLTCSCSFEEVCIDDRCKCIMNTGKNYISAHLILDKLYRESIFECGAFCSCNFNTCPNRLVQRGPNSRLEIRPTGNKGYGVFTLDTIAPGKFICEYAGELISKDIAKSRSQDSMNAQYILTLREYYGETAIENHIDAYKNGNIGRYVNHSCSPNSIIIPTRSGCIIPRAAIFTTRVVEADEEITYSYGEENSDVDFGEVCLCGSTECKGTLPLILKPI